MDYTLGLYCSISECHSVHARDPIGKGGAVIPLLGAWAGASPEP